MAKIFIVEINAEIENRQNPKNPVFGIASKTGPEIHQAVISSNYETIPIVVVHLFENGNSAGSIQSPMLMPSKGTTSYGQTLYCAFDLHLTDEYSYDLDELYGFYSIDENGKVFQPIYSPVKGEIQSENETTLSYSWFVYSMFGADVQDVFNQMSRPIVPMLTVTDLSQSISKLQTVDIMSNSLGSGADRIAVMDFYSHDSITIDEYNTISFDPVVSDGELL